MDQSLKGKEKLPRSKRMSGPPESPLQAPLRLGLPAHRSCRLNSSATFLKKDPKS